MLHEVNLMLFKDRAQTRRMIEEEEENIKMSSKLLNDKRRKEMQQLHSSNLYNDMLQREEQFCAFKFL